MSQRGHGGGNGGHGGGNGHGGNGGHGHDDKWNREAIHEPVDWMTYTHEQLYNMVHTGVNLESANAAATSWNKIGEDIAGVRENLLKAVEDSTVGWEGESARLARDGLTEITNWVHDTATYAQKVSSAITTETSNVEAARAAMPPPPKAPEPPVPTPTAVEQRPALLARVRQQQELHAVADSSMYTPEQNARIIAQQDSFAGFGTVGTSAVEALAANDASHRRAADVMAAFQRNSAAVDQTVPSQFTPPVNPVNPVLSDSGTGTRTPSNPDGTTAGGGAGGAVTPTPQNRANTNASRGGGAGGGFGGGRGGAGGGGGGGFTGGMGGFGRIPAANQNNQTGGGGGAGGMSSGGGAGVVGDGRSGAGAAAAASSAATGNQTRAFQNPLAMGAAPMAAGAPAAGGQNDEREHKSARYLEEDDNVFGLDRKAAPPVIGQ